MRSMEMLRACSYWSVSVDDARYSLVLEERTKPTIRCHCNKMVLIPSNVMRFTGLELQS
jgi:hypothetical protein